jgi:hypothetical protein
MYIAASVADLDQGPGSSAFLIPVDPGSKKNSESGITIPDHMSVFWVKNTYIFCCRSGSKIRCLLYPGSEIWDPGGSWMEKFGTGIWDKHPGSATQTSACPTFMPCLVSCIHYFCIMRAWAYSGKSCNDACMSAKYCTSPEGIHHAPPLLFLYKCILILQ